VLSSRYNLPSTPALISFEGTGAYPSIGIPSVYISNRLLVDGKRPTEFLTPLDEGITNAGWLQLCWKNPPPVENLRSFVASLMLYLKALPDLPALPEVFQPA